MRIYTPMRLRMLPAGQDRGVRVPKGQKWPFGQGPFLMMLEVLRGAGSEEPLWQKYPAWHWPRETQNKHLGNFIHILILSK